MDYQGFKLVYTAGPRRREFIIPRYLKGLFETSVINRMSYIHQLSFCHHPLFKTDLNMPNGYPQANYFRFEHLVGVLGLTIMVFEVNLRIYEEFKYLRKEIESAAFLHDIGHPPYSHTFELAGNNHEDYTEKFILEDPELKKVFEENDINPEVVAQLATGRADDKRLRAASSIITGSVGTDRLVYLERDGFLAGHSVNFMPEDVIRMYNIHADELVLDVPSQNPITQVYEMLKLRIILTHYLYGSLPNRSGTTMIKEVGERVLRDGRIDEEKLYTLTEWELLTELERITRDLEDKRYNRIANLLKKGSLLVPVARFTVKKEPYESSIERIRFDFDERLKVEKELERVLDLDLVLVDSDILPKVEKGNMIVRIGRKTKEDKKLREVNPPIFSYMSEQHDKVLRTFYVFSTSNKKVDERKIMEVLGISEKDLDVEPIFVF